MCWCQKERGDWTAPPATHSTATREWGVERVLEAWDLLGKKRHLYNEREIYRRAVNESTGSEMTNQRWGGTRNDRFLSLNVFFWIYHTQVFLTNNSFFVTSWQPSDHFERFRVATAFGILGAGGIKAAHRFVCWDSGFIAKGLKHRRGRALVFWWRGETPWQDTLWNQGGNRDQFKWN